MTRERREAFFRLRDRLCKLPVLAHPDFDKPFRLQTDASRTGVNALLGRRRAWHLR